MQWGSAPVHVPLWRHTTLLGPTSWNPGLQAKWTSWSTKYLLPNFLPSGGAFRAGQVTAGRKRTTIALRQHCQSPGLQSSGLC